MGQEEVLQWFKKRAQTGTNEWLTFSDARKKMRVDGIDSSAHQLNTQIRQLAKFGMLETKPEHWRCEFRYPEA